MKKQILVLSMLAALTACGEEDTGIAKDYYDGTTTPAVISATNAEDVLTEVVGSSSSGDAFSASSSGVGFKMMNKLAHNAPSLEETLTVLFSGGTLDGDCASGGGTMTVAISETRYDVTYKDFCVDNGDSTETTTNGSIKAGASKAVIDLTVTEGEDVAMSYGEMTTSVADDGTVTETIDFSMSSTASGITKSMKLDNFKVVTTDSPATMAMSGRIYSSDMDGYVDIDTTTAFAGSYFDSSSFFSNDITAGEAVITAGTSEVTLSVTADNQCSVTFDAEGDGTLELDQTEDCSNYF